MLNRKLASFRWTILPLPISNMSSLIRHFSKWPMRLYGTPTICNLSTSILTSFYIHSQGALNHTFWFQIHTGNTWFISFMWPVVYMLLVKCHCAYNLCQHIASSLMGHESEESIPQSGLSNMFIHFWLVCLESAFEIDNQQWRRTQGIAVSQLRCNIKRTDNSNSEAYCPVALYHT